VCVYTALRPFCPHFEMMSLRLGKKKPLRLSEKYKSDPARCPITLPNRPTPPLGPIRPRLHPITARHRHTLAPGALDPARPCAVPGGG